MFHVILSILPQASVTNGFSPLYLSRRHFEAFTVYCSVRALNFFAAGIGPGNLKNGKGFISKCLLKQEEIGLTKLKENF